MSVFTTPAPQIDCDCESYVVYCTRFNRYYCDECHWNFGCRGAQKHAIVCSECLDETYSNYLERAAVIGGYRCRNCL